MRSSILKVCAFSYMMLTASTALADVGQLFAIDSSRAFYEVDPNTGAKTLLCTVSSNAGTTGGLAYDRFNDIVYLTSTSNDSLYTLNTSTCAATLVGPYGGADVVMHGLEYDLSTGQLYGASGGGTPSNFNFYKIDKITGAATVVGPSGLTSFINLGYDSLNDVLYATNSGADSFYSVNRNTGAFTLIGPLVNSTNPNGMAYDWLNDQLFMVDNSTDTLYKLDRATGTANVVGSTGSGNLLGLMFIPEPSSLALLGGGLMLLIARRRGK